MKYVVARIGGRQYRLEEGQQIIVDRTGGNIDEVLLFVDGEDVRIGRPLVNAVKIKAKVVDEGFEKTEVRRFKAKSRYRKKKGHKQPKSTILVEEISCG
jgi:large subunit ribosomal protein L21